MKPRGRGLFAASTWPTARRRADPWPQGLVTKPVASEPVAMGQKGEGNKDRERKE